MSHYICPRCYKEYGSYRSLNRCKMKHTQQDRMLEQMYRNTIFSEHNTNTQKQNKENYYEELVDPIEEIAIGFNTEMDNFDPIVDGDKFNLDNTTITNKEFIDPERLPNKKKNSKLSNIPDSYVQRKRVLEIDNSLEVNVGLIGNHVLSLYYHWRILSKETNEIWNGEHWCYSTIFSKRWLRVENNLFKLGSIFQENDNYYVIISFFQNKKMEHTAILQQYRINKQVKFQQNQTLYELSPISPPYDQFDLQFQKVIDATETVEDGKKHIILPLIIYSDDFKFNSSLETQKSTMLNGIYLTFASQKRKTRKLENSHFPITFIPGTKNLFENLSPIINDLKKLEKGIIIKIPSNEEVMVFAPIILWITDFEEKAKLLGIKKSRR
ncbi:hypothetical protein M0813_16177 [Anaeramoeba flamelloides]|uniref:C2H2-type domain-containing protein n=1 Tax=Anaeramoeba flamelloides TaxID=1746091 RepID=A0ABQ8Z0H8_9EUKA|nr:hypothetical protein M0813_16177 [Anaeramoeba flamelloides]